MRAAVLFGPGDLRVQEVNEPIGEVVVEVHAATSCGTDVKMWRHGHPALGPYPCGIGHETAGVRLDTGERVLVSDSVPCGSCACCAAGRPQICRAPTWVLGGFAERIAAPEAALHPLPDGVAFASAAAAEPLAAAVHAIARGSEAAEVGILGGGPMGLMLAALLCAEGRTVTVADVHPERRAQAQAFGARAAVELGRHDLVFEAVGRPETWRAAIAAANPGACVVLVGGCPLGSEVSLPAGPIHYQELELRGTFHHSPEEVDRALWLLAGGNVDVTGLLSSAISLEELPRALASPGGGAARKWVVEPRL